MKLFPQWLRDALDDGTGHVSSTRLIAMATVTFTVLVPAVIWAELSLLRGEFVDVPGGFIGFIAAANTIVCGTFALNKRAE